MLFVINLILTAFFVFLGVLFRRGKGLSLVAGYNTMSKAEREKIDQDKLARYMSSLMFALAACFLVSGLGALLQIMILYWIGAAAFLLVIILGLIYINTGNRIRNN